jgi:hypothetical protein
MYKKPRKVDPYPVSIEDVGCVNRKKKVDFGRHLRVLS